MNIEICLRCKLKPFLWVRTYKKTDVIKYIVCSSEIKAKECFEMAEIDDETYQKLMKVLKYEGYFYDGYKIASESIEMICISGKKALNNILKDVEMNNQCPFQIEHQISKLNQKNES